jgi:hypothetical protein
MSIIEKPLNHWNQKLRYEKHKYPVCTCGNCPRFFCNILSVGSRGQGKTYSMCLLIKHWEDNTILDENGNEREIRTWLISPTIQANTVWNSLRSLDIENDVRDEYGDNTLKDILEEIKATKKESEDYMNYVNAYKKYIKLEDYQLHKLRNEDLAILAAYNFIDPAELPQPKYKFPPINIIILDDLLGSSCFNNKKQSYFQKQLIQNRHHQVCYAILVQAIKSVPKSIRLNCNVMWLGKFANITKVCDDVYEEVSATLTEEEFINLYLYAIDKEYGSLVIDMTGKKNRFLCGWNTELFISNNENKDDGSS